MVRLEIDDGVGLVDLLQIQRGGDGGSGLVEVVSAMMLVLRHICAALVNLPDGIDLLLLALLLGFPHEQMAVFCLAALHGHELVELKHSPLAAAVAFAALVEDGHTRVVNALLALPISALERLSAALPPAGHALLQCCVWVVILRFWGGRRRCCAWCSLSSRQAGSRGGQRL